MKTVEPDIRHIAGHNDAGMTVLEVLLAIIILSISSVVVLKFVSAGDVLFGKNVLLENASQLAQNEAEILKAQAPGTGSVEEREYETSMGGREFVVKRHVFEADSVDSLVSDYPLKGITIEIYEGYNEDYELPGGPILTFKYIQGFNVK